MPLLFYVALMTFVEPEQGPLSTFGDFDILHICI